MSLVGWFYTFTLVNSISSSVTVAIEIKTHLRLQVHDDSFSAIVTVVTMSVLCKTHFPQHYSEAEIVS